MRTISTTTICIALLAVTGIFVIYPAWRDQFPEPPAFKPMTPELFTGLIGWLFAVALLVERAVEVVVMVFRDQRADQLDKDEGDATKKLNEAAKSADALRGDDPNKAAAVDAARKAADSLAAVQDEKLAYRAETKEIALLTGFVFGIFVSLAGVRALHSLLADKAVAGTLFTAADIVITGAMLAGGSEGIHRMANAYNSFMDGLSAKGDQVQRNAQQDPKPKQ